jgi:L-lysine 2,3-aminomutase
VQLNTQNESVALAYIQANADIHEVILSGGDPLLLSDQKLSDLIQNLSSITHLKRIRLHTRKLRLKQKRQLIAQPPVVMNKTLP